ncbi:glycoside hydrolase family 19 protein [Cupriavidus sp. TMH.W2]|uniref:glycoside hydrolase family 19 protein n=1 Tax=Cupriavidus sp. TMH.W2 TaxID=3434465 RepID=UPI003D77BC70
MSRLIIKHESEWANAGKWKQLVGEIEKQTGPRALHGAEQERIEKLVWWDDVKSRVVDLPGSNAFHIHPIGLIGNFAVAGCKAQEISSEDLKRIATAAADELIHEYTAPLNQAFSDYKFDTCISQGHFLAQILHESGEFKYTRELGKTKSYDPWRGRGLIQITFESNYRSYQDYSKHDSTSNQTAMESLERPPHALLSAAWFYVIHSDLLGPSNADDFIWITRIINGGFNGYDDRLKYFNRAIQALNLQNCLKLNRNGQYRFEESSAYNEKRASCAWGMWHDPGLDKPGISNKDKTEALKGYKRYLELDSSAGSPVDKSGHPKDKNWYGIRGYVKSFVQDRHNVLEAI